jgi:peptide/nickel transport system substrate-binding protein
LAAPSCDGQWCWRWDRKPFIDILSDGQGKIGGVMLPPPEGVWGMPPEVLHALPGYAADVQ